MRLECREIFGLARRESVEATHFRVGGRHRTEFFGDAMNWNTGTLAIVSPNPHGAVCLKTFNDMRGIPRVWMDGWMENLSWAFISSPA